MAKRKVNRLASLLGNLAEAFELPYSLDSDGQGADLAIPYDNKVITSGYSFAPSEDSYEYVAALGHVKASKVPSVSARVIASEPIRGITERISTDGKYVVYSGRDGLHDLGDVQIQRGFMDDVARVTEAYDQFRVIVVRD